MFNLKVSLIVVTTRTIAPKTPHLLHTPRIVYVHTPTVPSVGGVTSTVKQTVKQIVPIDMNTEIPKLLLLLYFGC